VKVSRGLIIGGMEGIVAVPGRLLTPPGIEGLLTVIPLFNRRTKKVSALRVRVETRGGIAIVELRAEAAEMTVIHLSDPDGRVDRLRGSLWFYSRAGAEVGFRPSDADEALAIRGGLETTRDGSPYATKGKT